MINDEKIIQELKDFIQENKSELKEFSPNKKQKLQLRTTQSGQFAKRMLIFSIFIIVTYIITCFALQVLFQISLNDTLTTCVFNFFGLEVGLLMIKKLFETFDIKQKAKVKIKNDGQNSV